MFQSKTLKFLLVGFLALLMSIPLVFVTDIIEERADYSTLTKSELGREWGGPQSFVGIVLEIPVEESVEKTVKVPITDPNTGEVLYTEKGYQRTQHVTEVDIEDRSSVFLLPDRFDQTTATSTSMRKRGIFNVPVYQATSRMVFNFDAAQVSDALSDREMARFEDARILVQLGSNAALRGEISLSIGDTQVPFEPSDTGTGLIATVGDLREADELSINLQFNGAESYVTSAPGRTNAITITGDWPDPSFRGAFLPDRYDISDEGFDASWNIPHLARPIPTLSREAPFAALRETASFGLDFFEPNDFYQRSYRAARYGLLFVALTFLTVLLLDRNTERPVHSIQYVIIGLAQSVFLLLMVSLAEQIGFTGAYLAAAGATTTLIATYAHFGLGFAKRAWLVAIGLAATYAILLFILSSA
ncbi:MAG: cell envelope integrity protein CreD, partial [Pseudomonadota bacterium]